MSQTKHGKGWMGEIAVIDAIKIVNSTILSSNRLSTDVKDSLITAIYIELRKAGYNRT